MSLPLFRPRQPLVPIALAAIAGILGSDVSHAPWWLGALLGAVSLALALWCRRAWMGWLGVAGAFATLHALQDFASPARELSARFQEVRAPVHAEGIVWSEPEPVAAHTRHPVCRFVLQLEQVEHAGAAIHTSAQVLVRWLGVPPAYGDRVRIYGALGPLAGPQNEGQFNFAAYQARRGIVSELVVRYLTDAQVLSHGHGSAVQSLAFRTRDWIKHTLERDLEDSPEVAGLIQSMVLGMRGDTPEEMKDLFRRTGTMHLFAVSGLNVAMLAALAWYLLKPLRVPRAWAVLLIIPLLGLYALLTGLSASCVRACIMGALVLAAFVVDRPPSVFNSVAAAALVILAWDSNQLFQPGFQLSFVLVLVLVSVGAWLQRVLRPWGRPDAFLPEALWNWRQHLQVRSWNLLSGSVSVAVAAWLGSLFFTAQYFHLISSVTVFANLIAVPLAFAMLSLGLAAVLAVPFSNLAAAWCNNANWLCAKALLGSMHFFAQVPGGFQYVAGALPRWSPPACEISVLQVGSGGAVHVHAAGRDWLLDCAHVAEYERIVRPYLRTHGVNTLCGLLLTHGDAQHLGAAPLVLEEFAPPLLLDGTAKPRPGLRRKLHELLAQRGFPKRLLRRDDVVELAPGVSLRVLYPPSELPRNSGDDQALVLRLEAAGQRVLFMGDAGFLTERWLLEQEPDLRAEVLVKGQHARDFSGTPDFLLRVQPRLIIDGEAEEGPQKERDAEWQSTTRAAGYTVYPQATAGAVQLELRPEEIVARPFRGAVQRFRSRSR